MKRKWNTEVELLQGIRDILNQVSTVYSVLKLLYQGCMLILAFYMTYCIIRYLFCTRNMELLTNYIHFLERIEKIC